MDGKKYDIGLVIAVHNRYELTRNTFINVNDSIIPENCCIIIVNDCSSDTSVEHLCDSFAWKADAYILHNENNLGIAHTLRRGFDLAIEKGCRILVNLDNDVEVKKEWLEVLLELHRKYSHSMITGFRANNPQHKTISEHNGYCRRKSLGGINMLFNQIIYNKVVKPCLKDNHWDWQVSHRCNRLGVRILCVAPSVVQHKGFDSLLNHADTDIAEDY